MTELNNGKCVKIVKWLAGIFGASATIITSTIVIMNTITASDRQSNIARGTEQDVIIMKHQVKEILENQEEIIRKLEER